MSKKQIIGIVGAVLVLIVSMFMPAMGEISQVGMRTIGMLAAFLILLVTEALPVVVISLIFCALMPLLGVVPSFGKALSGYSEPIVFFTLASFGIAAALTNIPLSQRILRALLKAFGKNVGLVMLSMMVACAVLSSIVSNVPTCAIFMTLALNFLKLYDNEEDRKRSGRAFYDRHSRGIHDWRYDDSCRLFHQSAGNWPAGSALRHYRILRAVDVRRYSFGNRNDSSGLVADV